MGFERPIGEAFVLITPDRVRELPCGFQRYFENFFVIRLVGGVPMRHARVVTFMEDYQVGDFGSQLAPGTAESVKRYGTDEDGRDVIEWLFANRRDPQGNVFVDGWTGEVMQPDGEIRSEAGSILVSAVPRARVPETVAAGGNGDLR